MNDLRKMLRSTRGEALLGEGKVAAMSIGAAQRVARRKQEEEIEADVVDSGGRYSQSSRGT